jgi:hypothetical protein
MRRSSFVSGRLINPVMTKLIENGIEITAVHNALGYDALNAEKARMTEDGAAVFLNVLYQSPDHAPRPPIEPPARPCGPQGDHRVDRGR